MCIYYIPRKLSDLNGVNILKEISLSQLKKNTEIMVIDDDEFVYLDSLKRSEYCIEYRPDIQSLKDVAEYDIILCDIRGVGKFLNSPFEGAYLVKQIKEKYPNKIVISYTANNYDPKFQEYLAFADATIPKGTALEDWDSMLTKMLKELADPVKQWEKARKALLAAGVSTVMVAKYESEYVKAVKNGDYKSLKDVYENSKKPGKDIMISLLSIIFKTLGIRK